MPNYYTWIVRYTIEISPFLLSWYLAVGVPFAGLYNLVCDVKRGSVYLLFLYNAFVFLLYQETVRITLDRLYNHLFGFGMICINGVWFINFLFPLIEDFLGCCQLSRRWDKKFDLRGFVPIPVISLYFYYIIVMKFGTVSCLSSIEYIHDYLTLTFWLFTTIKHYQTKAEIPIGRTISGEDWKPFLSFIWPSLVCIGLGKALSLTIPPNS